MSTRLERSVTNRVWAGICGGIGEYLQVDPTLVRVFFVVGTVLTGGLGFLGYIVLLVLMPLPGRPAPFVQTGASSTGAGSAATDATAPIDATAPLGAAAPTAPHSAPLDPEAADRRRAVFGYLLVALGAVALLANAGVFRFVRWDIAWPLVLVAAGVLLLAQRMRR